MNHPLPQPSANVVVANRPDHAKHSPSGAHRRFVCHGSLTLESAFPNKGSAYSDDGTAKHYIASICLEKGTEAAEYVGTNVPIRENGQFVRTVEFTPERAEPTQQYIDYVRSVVGDDLWWVEQQVEFGQYIDVPDQFGTADVILLREYWDDETQAVAYELVVIDAKFGHRPVAVEANPQLLYYALGSYGRLHADYDIRRVRLVIYQPEHGGESEWTCDVDYLLAFANTARSHETSVRVAHQEYLALPADPAKHVIWVQTFLHNDPNDEDCAFCRAMSTCPAVRAKLEREVGASFQVIDDIQAVPHAPDEVVEINAGQPEQVFSNEDLGRLMRVAPLIEDWATAVRAETERRLLEVKNDPAVCEEFGFGLELGRQGHRKWTETKAAEQAFKTFRLKVEEMYDMKLISPTRAEELATQKRNRKGEAIGPEPVIGPTQWKRLQKLIRRAEPKPSVKPLEQIKQLWTPPALESSAFTEVPDDEEESLG